MQVAMDSCGVATLRREAKPKALAACSLPNLEQIVVLYTSKSTGGTHTEMVQLLPIQ